MKNERSIPFSQSWCSLVATDVCRNPAPKKRFLDEYESSLCYRKSAKEIIQKGLFLDIVNVQAQKRESRKGCGSRVFPDVWKSDTCIHKTVVAVWQRVCTYD